MHPSAIRAATANYSEGDLLLCCCRTSLDPETHARILTLLAGKFDWEYLLQLANSHGAAALLYSSLKKIRPQSMPPHVFRILRANFMANLQKNSEMSRELVRILKLLEEHQIAAVPFKGPALSVSAFGSVAFRQFDDLDILIRQQDIARSEEILINHGYLRSGPEGEAPEVDSPYHIFVRQDGSFRLDMQSQIAEKHFAFHLDRDSWWSNLEAVELAGESVRTLSPENMLLILSVHGSKHLWEKTLHICDVAALVRAHPALDWRAVTKQAATMGCERMLALALVLASDLLGVVITDKRAQRLMRERTVQTLAVEMAERLFRTPPAPMGEIETAAIYLRLKNRWFDRARYSLHILLCVDLENENRALLPRMVVFCHHLLQPVRLVSRRWPYEWKKAIWKWLER